MKKVEFKFDERSLIPMDAPLPHGAVVWADTIPQQLLPPTKIVVRDVETGIEREMWIPTFGPRRK